jgi:hypothetical protein
VNDCAGCRHMDETADGALFCAHPICHGPITDPEQPPCEGVWFESRFHFPGEVPPPRMTSETEFFPPELPTR